MIRNIIINESQLSVLKEFENKEVNFHNFQSNVKGYLKELIKNPLKPTYNKFFTENNINENELQDKLTDLGILKKKKEGFNEPEDSNGKKHSVHYKQFAVSNSNFDENMHKLYDMFFQSGERKSINEEGEGGFGGGALGGCNVMAGSSDSTGGVTYPFGQIQRRAGYNSQRKKKTNDITKQDSNVDMTPAISRKDGKGGSISIPKERK